MADYGIGILGVSHYLPEQIQTNEQLCALIPELTPEWILNKTGIKRRYYISPEESASTLAIEATRKVLEKTGIDKSEIGLVVLASFSQDYLFPPLSARIHAAFGLEKSCQIIDINVNCTGLVTAASIAAERMKADASIGNALIIGVEVLSRFTSPTDKDTAIFFSDGAFALMLGKVAPGSGYSSAKFLTDSSTYESVRMRGGGSSHPSATRTGDSKILFIEQNGLATWKQAITNLPVVIRRLLDSEQLTFDQIDFFVFHQANGFLIDYLLKKLHIPVAKTYTNVEEIGNTGSASIGIALSEAFDRGLIRSGDNIVLAGVGAGFNFGACLFKMQ